MPDPRELLGLGQNGLGAITQGLESGFAASQAERAAQLEQAKTLQEMFLKQQTESRLSSMHPLDLEAKRATTQGTLEGTRKTRLSNDETEALLPGAIQVGKGKQQTELTDQQLKGMQQLGQLAVNFAPALERMPPQQRQATMQQIMDSNPAFANSPIFQSLMQQDPRMLPNVMKQYGTHLLMQTQEFMQKSAMQRQQDEAAMARQQVVSGTQKDIAQMQIDAGRFKKSDLKDPMALATKLGYEKASVAYRMAANEEQDPQLKQAYDRQAQQFHNLHLQSRSAGVRPGMVFDPATGSFTMQGPMAEQYMEGPTQGRPMPQGLPSGTSDNGDGTYTLPDGRRVRPKQQ